MCDTVKASTLHHAGSSLSSTWKFDVMASDLRNPHVEKGSKMYSPQWSEKGCPMTHSQSSSLFLLLEQFLRPTEDTAPVPLPPQLGSPSFFVLQAPSALTVASTCPPDPSPKCPVGPVLPSKRFCAMGFASPLVMLKQTYPGPPNTRTLLFSQNEKGCVLLIS